MHSQYDRILLCFKGRIHTIILKNVIDIDNLHFSIIFDKIYIEQFKKLYKTAKTIMIVMYTDDEYSINTFKLKEYSEPKAINKDDVIVTLYNHKKKSTL